MGIKPFYYAPMDTSSLCLRTPPLALRMHATQVNPKLVYIPWESLYDHTRKRFFEGLHNLPPGHWMTWIDAKSVFPSVIGT